MGNESLFSGLGGPLRGAPTERIGNSGRMAVGDDILHNIMVYCVHNDIDVRLEFEWRADTRAIILYRQPNICQEIRRTVPRQ